MSVITRTLKNASATVTLIILLLSGMWLFDHYSNDQITYVTRPQTLWEARERTKQRLIVLRDMTEEDWEEQKRLDPRRPSTLDKAIVKNEIILARLYDMLEEDWDTIAMQVKVEKEFSIEEYKRKNALKFDTQQAKKKAVRLVEKEDITDTSELERNAIGRVRKEAPEPAASSESYKISE